MKKVTKFLEFLAKKLEVSDVHIQENGQFAFERRGKNKLMKRIRINAYLFNFICSKLELNQEVPFETVNRGNWRVIYTDAGPKRTLVLRKFITHDSFTTAIQKGEW